jgi:hypothetical protein
MTIILYSRAHKNQIFTIICCLLKELGIKGAGVVGSKAINYRYITVLLSIHELVCGMSHNYICTIDYPNLREACSFK